MTLKTTNFCEEFAWYARLRDWHRRAFRREYGRLDVQWRTCEGRVIVLVLRFNCRVGEPLYPELQTSFMARASRNLRSPDVVSTIQRCYL